MNEFGTAKEALLVEAMGDVGRLLDRADALQSALIDSTQRLLTTQTRLTEQLATCDAHVAGITERAKVLAVKHIITRTDEAARRSLDAQSRAMAEAGREVFKTELAPALQRLVHPLNQLYERMERPWEVWLTHLAAAAVGSALTLAVWTWVIPS